MKKSIYQGHLIRLNTPIASKKLSAESAANQIHDADDISAPISKLFQYGFTDWEQLYALSKIEGISESLMAATGVDSTAVLKQVFTSTAKHLPAFIKANLKQFEDPDHALGAKRPVAIEKAYGLDLAVNLEMAKNRSSKRPPFLSGLPASSAIASSVSHVGSLTPIKNQGNRGTCTSFAVTAANEFCIFMRPENYPNLSEQHLFNLVKVLEGDSDCGAWCANAMKIIRDIGQCRESIWGYNPNLPCVQHSGKPSNADQDALSFKNDFLPLNQNDVTEIKTVIASGRIVPFSIPVFDSWNRSAETARTGRITMPLPGETENGGHSMVFAGYQDQAETPGGGYFILRNSWGKIWGSANFYGPGYGVIPYEYIENYCWEAFAFQ